MPQTPRAHRNQKPDSKSLKSSRPSCRKDLLGRGNTVGQREFKALGDELLEVWAANVGSLLELDNFEDLFIGNSGLGRA